MMLATPENTLIVFALESEERGLFSGFTKTYCGVGKVNAAYGLMRALGAWREEKGASPKLILNLGSAGSPKFKMGSVINCTQFYQRDMDTTAFGTPLYTTPSDSEATPLIMGARIKSYAEGICGTGDSFVTDGALKPWDVIDMEGYAFAKVCGLERLPFACLKYITDGADGAAATTWEEALADAAKNLRQALGTIVG